MNPRSTVLLLLAAAALGAFVYLYEVKGGEERKEAETAAKRLFPDVQATDVQFVELATTDGGKARAERHEGAWRLVDPMAFPGDAVNLDGIAAGLADLASEQVIESPQAAEIYGLGEAARKVRFGAAGKEHELRIGNKAPLASSTYVASAADPQRVVTVPTYRITNLDRSVDDLRDRRVASFDRASIGSIEVRWPGGHVKLAHGDGGWRILEPVEGAADDTTVDQLLSNLSYLRADSFEDSPGDPAEDGFDVPALDVTLVGRPGAGGAVPAPVRVTFGAEQDGKRLVRGAQPSLYRVAAQRLEDIPKTVTAYRFKELSRYVATDAKSVALRFTSRGGTAFDETVTQGEGGWKGAPEPVEPGKVARLVAEMARLRAEDIVQDAASEDDLVKLGLSPPRARIQILGTPEGDAAPAELALVEIGDDDGRGPVARTPGLPAVFRLAPGVLEWLPTGLEAFREDFVQKPGEAPAPADGPGDALDATEATGAEEGADGPP